MRALCFENSTAVVPPPGLCVSAQILTRRGETLRPFSPGASASSNSTSEAEESEAESMGW